MILVKPGPEILTKVKVNVKFDDQPPAYFCVYQT